MIVLDKLNGFARFAGKCSQGIVGRCNYMGETVVWKVAKRANFTCESEYETGRTIMQSPLGVLPHFVKVLDCMDVYLSSDDKVKRKCLLMEEVKGGRFLDVIVNCGECEDVLNIAKQVLISVAAAQEIVHFTHYDLHVENVLVKETDDDKHVYILPDGGMHVVDTNGLCAVIIDYGYAYTSGAKTILPSLYHNQAGFKSYQFSPLADTMTLLCSIIEEFKYSKSHFVALVHKMFKSMGSALNWECGWFEGFTNFPKEMGRMMKPPICEVRSDSIFRDAPLIVDLVQALVPLPLTPDETFTCTNTFTSTFAKLYYQWFLIEEELANPELEALFLKTVVRAMGSKSVGPKELIGDVFGREFEVEYDTIVECIWHLAKMVRAGIAKMDKRDTERRDRYYSKLDVSCALDVFKRLDFKPIIFKRDDLVRFFDLRNGTTFTATVTKTQAKRLNNDTLTLEGLYSEVS